MVSLTDFRHVLWCIKCHGHPVGADSSTVRISWMEQESESVTRWHSGASKASKVLMNHKIFFSAFLIFFRFCGGKADWPCFLPGLRLARNEVYIEIYAVLANGEVYPLIPHEIW